MAKAKFDVDVIKVLLFGYGEKAALVLCVIVSLSLITMGMMQAGKYNGLNYAQRILDEVNKINAALAAVTAKEEDPAVLASLNPSKYSWPPGVSNFDPSAMVNLQETRDDKRRNPQILSIRPEPENFKLDYVRALNYAYDVSPSSGTVLAVKPIGKASKENPSYPAAKTVAAQRLVMVSCVFPMKQQVEIYREAFRMGAQTELFSQKDLLPRALGLNIVRMEVQPGGAPVTQSDLIRLDPKTNVVQVAPWLTELYRTTLVDEEFYKAYEPYVHSGLVTALPLLANEQPPEIKLRDVKSILTADKKAELAKFYKPPVSTKPVEIDKNRLPGQGGNPQPALAAPTAALEYVKWTAVDKADASLQSRFAGKFDPFVQTLISQQAGKTAPSPFDKGVNTKAPESTDNEQAPAVTGIWNFDALVHFVDSDVEPGKTYRYAIQVRMANPNFGHKDKVAFQALAEVKELLSPGVFTPDITIPQEYNFYAVDQNQLNQSEPRSAFPAPYPRQQDSVPFQIHRWFDRGEDAVTGTKYNLGEWAIAERVPVRRGEYIGQVDLVTKLPVWNPLTNFFEAVYSTVVDSKKRQSQQLGIPLSFRASNPPPLLVDFTGGKRIRDIPKSATQVQSIPDESAFDALILTTEGQLVVRNSRVDSDTSTLEGSERNYRYETWRERVNRTYTPPADPNAPANPGGIRLPGLPGLPGVPGGR